MAGRGRLSTPPAGPRTSRSCFDARPALSREPTGPGWPQAVAQRRFRVGWGPRAGSLWTGRRGSKTLRRLAKQDHLDPQPPSEMSGRAGTTVDSISAGG